MHLKKILIISYFFPPCNLTASQRVLSWANDLNKFGYYPIIITRKWETNIETLHDMSIATTGNEVHQIYDNYEVYYLPYKSTLKDKIYALRSTNRFLVFFRKALSFTELIGQNYFNSFIPFSNFYDRAEQLISADPSIQKLVISASPFVSFRFGYLLRLKFNSLRWIADYRDDWTTSDIINKKNGLYGLLKILENRKEKLWVGTASFICSVSDHYTSKVSDLVKVDGFTLYNGYGEDVQPVQQSVNKDSFIITYNGTLYSTQPIDYIIHAFLKVVNEYKNKLKLTFCFPGLAFDLAQENRVKKLIVGYEEFFKISGRVSKNEVIEVQRNSDILVMTAHTNQKGIPSSKIFEYIGLNKSFIVCPGDGDILDKLAEESGLGTVCNSSESAYRFIKERIEIKIKGDSVNLKLDSHRITKFSRIHQTKILAYYLDKL
jgi:hypothetical protein